MGRIVLNIEKLTGDIAQITGENKSKITETIEHTRSLMKQLDGFVSDDSPEGFKAGWEKAVASLHRIDSVLKNMEDITGKINRGEGTIGKLVNDEETVERLNEAIGSVNDFVGGAGNMETSVDFHSEFLTDASLTKSYLNIKIQPGLDRYYLLGVVDDPRGVREQTTLVQTGNPAQDYERTETFKNKLKFNAIFAKNFYDFTVRGGMMESAGGLGFDYSMFSRKLQFSVDAFDFDDLMLRAYLKFNIFKGIYMVGGGDHLADPDLRSPFIGAGIFITNDDLKLLATKFSAP